jgi:hypothetical protein
MQDFSLNFDDILNENLMPAALMLIEEKDSVAWRNLSSEKLDNEFECVTKEKIKEDGGFPNALHSMRFHRKMINEFLCSKFVAEKILEDIKPTQMKRRLGLAVTSSSEIESVKNNSLSAHNTVTKRMLFDEGSYQYKNWLAK